MGALIDFMPQPEAKIDTWPSKTIKGCFVRHHVHSGGVWSGDYLVAEYVASMASCDVIRGKVKFHRAKEIVNIVNNVYELPIAQRRTYRIWKDRDSCVPEAEDVIEDDNNEGVIEAAEDLVLTDGLDAADVDERLSVRAGASPGRIDVRGSGTEVFPGRAAGKPVRARKGTTRLKNVSLEPWRTSSAYQKRDAISGYEASLTKAPTAMVASRSSGAPALPRQDGEVDDQIHRGKDGDPLSIYPCCTARNVGRVEIA